MLLWRTLTCIAAGRYTPSSAMQLVQYPVLLLSLKLFGNNYVPLNGFVLGLVVLVGVPMVAVMWKRLRRFDDAWWKAARNTRTSQTLPRVRGNSLGRERV